MCTCGRTIDSGCGRLLECLTTIPHLPEFTGTLTNDTLIPVHHLGTTYKISWRTLVDSILAELK